MSEAAVTALAAIGLGLIVSVVGYLICHTINLARAEITGVSTKVDRLAAEDTEIKVLITEMRIRLASVEVRLADVEHAFRRGL